MVITGTNGQLMIPIDPSAWALCESEKRFTLLADRRYVCVTGKVVYFVAATALARRRRTAFVKGWLVDLFAVH